MEIVPQSTDPSDSVKGKHSIIVRNIKRVIEPGLLKGFCAVHIDGWLIFDECRYLVDALEPETVWPTLPKRSWRDKFGRRRHASIVQVSPAVYEQIQAAMLVAWEEFEHDVA